MEYQSFTGSRRDQTAAARGRPPSLRATALLAVLTVSLAGGGCDLLQKDVTAPDAASPFVSLSVSPATVPPDGGDVDLVATVTDPDGTPRPDVDVEFKASAGELDPADPVKTDDEGQARAKLRTEEPAEVQARVGIGPFSIAESSMVTIGVSEEQEAQPGEVTLQVEVTPEEAELREEVTFVVEALADGERVGGDLEVEFGDGRSTREPEFGGRTRITHTFREVGRFRVVFTLSDADGNRLAREGVRVPVTEPVKTIVRVSAPEQAEAESPVPIDITVEGEDGSSAEGRVTVDLGDGRSRQLGAVSGTHTLEVKYRDPGRYRIVAVVEDEDGITHQDGTGVRIVEPVSYTSELSLSDSSPVAGTPTTVTLEITASDGGAARGDVLFEFGDDRTSHQRDVRGSASVDHTWTEPDTYTVRATFDDGAGRTTTSQRSVTVVEEDSGGGDGGGGDGGGGGTAGGDALDPSQIAYADPTAARALSWPVTRELDVIHFFSGNQSWTPGSVAGWPGKAFFNPGKHLAGNLWFIRNVNGRWEAAPLEWFFEGMTRQFMTEQTIREHAQLRSTWGSWAPRQGEQLYFFLSTPAWFNARTVNERTNIVPVVWGCSGNC